MNELKLQDRVVLEIRCTDSTDRLCSDYIEEQLHKIAHAIHNGMKGDIWKDEDIDNGEVEIMWERECTSYGFPIGKQSLICQHYYNSEKKRATIGDELMERIRDFNRDYNDNEEKIGEDIYTKTDFLNDAARLLADIEEENYFDDKRLTERQKNELGYE